MEQGEAALSVAGRGDAGQVQRRLLGPHIGRGLGRTAQLEHHQPARKPRTLGQQGRRRERARAAVTDHQGHILLAVDLIGRRGGDDAVVGLVAPQLGPVGGVVGRELALSRALEDQAPGGRHHPGVPEIRMLDREARLLRDRIPGDQLALHHRLDGRHLRRVGGQGVGEEVGADVPGARPEGVTLVRGIGEGHHLGWDVDQTLLRIEGHRVPVVRAERGRDLQRRRVLVAHAGVLDRTAGGRIDTRGPGDRHIGFGRDQLAVRAVQHIEEAVLRRLHQHLTRLAVDCQVGQDDVLGGRVVPALAGRRLIVPDVLASVGLQGQDGGEE